VKNAGSMTETCCKKRRTHGVHINQDLIIGTHTHINIYIYIYIYKTYTQNLILQQSLNEVKAKIIYFVIFV
jgi:hypothetical protein